MMHPKMGGTIFQLTSDRRLVVGICMELKNLNNNKNSTILMFTIEVTTELSKEEIHMAKIHLAIR